MTESKTGSILQYLKLSTNNVCFVLHSNTSESIRTLDYFMYLSVSWYTWLAE